MRSKARARTCKPGQTVLANVRPEAIAIGAPGDGLAGKVVTRTYLGEKMEYEVEVAGQTLADRALQPAAVGALRAGRRRERAAAARGRAIAGEGRTMMHRLSAFAIAAALALSPAAAPRAGDRARRGFALRVSDRETRLGGEARRERGRNAGHHPGHRGREPSVIRVDGVDPFTKDRKVFVAARPLDRETDLAIPRAQFADHPSTEIHFFASAEDAAANKPKLTVFYLGVPDTTPEFAARGRGRGLSRPHASCTKMT